MAIKLEGGGEGLNVLAISRGVPGTCGIACYVHIGKIRTAWVRIPFFSIRIEGLKQLQGNSWSKN